MMAAQHNCKGLVKFILLDDMVTVDMEVMTVTGIHIYRQDKNCSEKSFIPWSEENTLPPAFLKREKPKQRNQKNFWNPFWTKIWNRILDLNNPVNALK